MKKKTTEKRSKLFGRPGELLIDESAVAGTPPPIQFDERRPPRRAGRGPLTVGAPASTGEGTVEPFPTVLRPVPPSLEEAQTVLQDEEEPLAVSDGDPDTEESLPAGDDDDGHNDGSDATAISLIDDEVRTADEQATFVDLAAARARSALASEGLGIQVRLRTARLVPPPPAAPMIDSSLNDLVERVRPRTDLAAEDQGTDQETAFDAGVFDDDGAIHPAHPPARPQPPASEPAAPHPAQRQAVPAPPTTPMVPEPLAGPVHTEPTEHLSGVYVRPVGSQPPIRASAPSGPRPPAAHTPTHLGPPPETRAALLAAAVDDLPNHGGRGTTTAPASAPPRRVNASLAPMDTQPDRTPLPPKAAPVPLARAMTAPPGKAPRLSAPTVPPRAAGAPVHRAPPPLPSSPGALPINVSAPPPRAVPPVPGPAAPPDPAHTPANVRPVPTRNDGPAMMVVGVLIGLMIAGGVFWLVPRPGAPGTAARPAEADPVAAPPAPTTGVATTAPPATPAPSPPPATDTTTAGLPPSGAPPSGTTPSGTTPSGAMPPTAAGATTTPTAVPTAGTPSVAPTTTSTTPPTGRTPNATGGTADTTAGATPRTRSTARVTEPRARYPEDDEVRLEAGYIRVITDRKCLVIVDGEQRGYAPDVGKIELLPGGHTLRCIVAGAGASRETDFRVDSGALREIELRFGE